MEISNAKLTEIAEAAEVDGDLPPQTVLHALTSLTGGQVPEACVSEMTVDGERTTWRTVALTATHVVVAEATAQSGRWTSQSEASYEKVERVPLIEAEAFPRHTLTRLEVVETTPVAEARHAEPVRRQWFTTWRLHFGDVAVALPARTPSEGIVEALRKAL